VPDFDLDDIHGIARISELHPPADGRSQCGGDAPDSIFKRIDGADEAHSSNHCLA
jgi:hypothetical protein